MQKLTREALTGAKIGDTLCDMHGGLPPESEMNVSEAFIALPVADMLLHYAYMHQYEGEWLAGQPEGAKVPRWVGPRSYSNKDLVLVNRDEDTFTAVFIYDGRYAKIVSFSNRS